MTINTKEEKYKWVCDQIKKYEAIYPKYVMYAQTLQQVLKKAVQKYATLAIVETRPKSIASFAEKILRKKYKEPFKQTTDLCGGRVITHTQSEVNAICKFIEKNFDVDWDNSVDVCKRLKPTEFGYRSIHYIVQFRQGVFPNGKVDVAIPREVYPSKKLGCLMKAEIQVRTLLEHAWASFSHDKAYKGTFTIPEEWQHELAGLAAMLEEADKAFSRIQTGLQTYATSYGLYISEEQMREEMALQEIVLACDPQNVEVANRIGKLAITLGEWQKAIDLLSRYVKSDYKPILRDLGVALCKKHHSNPTGPQYKRGQKYLEAASAPPTRDVDALTSLAGTWKALDEDRVRSIYRQAFEVDSSDPYALSNYLVYEIIYRKDTSPVALMSPAIGLAMQRCREHADVGINLPWAFYNMGMFYLLLGKPYDSLAAYSKAIQLSTSYWMIETSLRLLEKLTVIGDTLPGYEWMCKLLLIGWAVKFPIPAVQKRLKQYALTGNKPITGPVVILCGSCNVEQEIQSYSQIVLDSFQDFKGTLISGGTKAGISGLAGNVQKKYPSTIHTIGYVPEIIPTSVDIDKRYIELRSTKGRNFSPLEPLQYWADLTTSGIQPDQVKLLGINGGAISAAEYRMALALGARVAIIEGSGRAASKLSTDADWKDLKQLVLLPTDTVIIRAFIGSGISKLEPDIREILAQFIHKAYQEDQAVRKSREDPSMADWDRLPDYLQESNRQTADHIAEKLSQIDCSIYPIKGREISLMTFTDIEVEIMAEMEHDRWVVERLLDGWKLAQKRDVAKKISPYLVSWSELPDDVKEWDRETVRRIPEFLAKVGLEVRRRT